MTRSLAAPLAAALAAAVVSVRAAAVVSVRPALVAALAAAGQAGMATRAHAASAPLPGLLTGFTEPLFQSAASSVREQWLARAAQEHANVVRLNVSWDEVTRKRPPSEAAATDPSWEGYDWASADASIGDAVADGLQVQLTLAGGAPAWAESPGRPKRALRGTWKPDPSAYAAFARAAALRYSGAYTPPGAAAPLPRVRYWQAWNEPNLAIYLTPQWRRASGRWAPASPSVYRALLDAFYDAVKAAQPDALVLAAGTAPYGDVAGGERMPPAQFVRNLLCLDESGRRAQRCGEPARFDILDHHPYSVQGPFFRAFNKDDVAVADMAKLTAPLRQAERLGTVGGARHHQVWVTELSWDSSPPDPHGVPALEQARWLEQSFHLLWHEGVSVVMWYLIVDQPPVPSYATTYQSGVYLLDGRAKPSATAFRFPFVVERARRSPLARGRAPASGAVATAWGRAPASGTVAIELDSHGRWRLLRRIEPQADGVFQLRLPVERHALLRARQGAQTSLPWPL